jgi:hypothetical protein
LSNSASSILASMALFPVRVIQMGNFPVLDIGAEWPPNDHCRLCDDRTIVGDNVGARESVGVRFDVLGDSGICGGSGQKAADKREHNMNVTDVQGGPNSLSFTQRSRERDRSTHKGDWDKRRCDMLP